MSKGDPPERLLEAVRGCARPRSEERVEDAAAYREALAHGKASVAGPTHPRGAIRTFQREGNLSSARENGIIRTQ